MTGIGLPNLNIYLESRGHSQQERFGICARDNVLSRVKHSLLDFEIILVGK